jgi:solute:Na+ symporter, SSS family
MQPIAYLAIAGPHHIRAIDLLIVVLYLAAITLFGLHFRSKGDSLRSYFLAERTIPWWAISLSIVAAETSTLTIISVPGLAFTGDFGFLQLVMGYLVARVVLCLLFLPAYFHGELLTAYQLIDRRFGPKLHKVTAMVFLLTRAAAEGVRLFAVSILIGIAIGTGDIASIVIITVLTLLYTIKGGMTAVIWTDVVQMFIYVGGSIAALWALGHQVPGGWGMIHQVGCAAGKFTVFHFALNLTTTYTFWTGLIGGCFLTMASHGTDQLMVQRLLAAKDLRESRLALMSSWVIVALQFVLFLCVGAGLYVYYGRMAPGTTFSSPDRIFPAFIVDHMPVGVSGLILAAVLAAAMSNLSAALNSLSSTTVVDFYMKLRPKAAARERSSISHISTFFWAVVLCGLAFVSRGSKHVVEVGLSIASVAYGSLLGVFLLGTLTRRANEAGTIVGMIFGLGVNLFLWLQSAPIAFHFAGMHGALPRVAWTWYVVIGTAITFSFGYLFSLLFSRTRWGSQSSAEREFLT